MSVQAGLWNLDEKPVEMGLLSKMREITLRLAPDGEHSYLDLSVGMTYGAFHTTADSRVETQPCVSSSGRVLMWDGRLDNRAEILSELRLSRSSSLTDCEVVMAAFDQWGVRCFSRLVGDWAFSVWDPKKQILLLSKDFVGSRSLFYQRTANRVVWCTCLDPIVLLEGRPWRINDEYVAGFIVSYPQAHLTPYCGIDAVPPGCWVEITKAGATTHRYWDFDYSEKIRYRTDFEYEQHFRHVFGQAVARRLRSDGSVLAELSGGVDSSSIVCMADLLIANGVSGAKRLDTVSYFDEQEPSWDERPYFTQIETKRGRTGTHIDVSGGLNLAPVDAADSIVLPVQNSSTMMFRHRLSALMKRNGNRVLLSGIGGDEVLGGVTTPIPELANLITRLELVEFCQKLKAWSLKTKKPWIRLIYDLCVAFSPIPELQSLFSRDSAPPWLDRTFARCQRRSSRDYWGYLLFSKALPSQQAFQHALSALACQIACNQPSDISGCEMRYPYLDRDLCVYLNSIPREQIIRPGQRRSLMRRALAEIVPSDVLNRKRKGFVARRPLVVLEDHADYLHDLFRNPLSSRVGYIDAHRFSESLYKTKHGYMRHMNSLIRSIKIEVWLKYLEDRRLLEAL